MSQATQFEQGKRIERIDEYHQKVIEDIKKLLLIAYNESALAKKSRKKENIVDHLANVEDAAVKADSMIAELFGLSTDDHHESWPALVTQRMILRDEALKDQVRKGLQTKTRRPVGKIATISSSLRYIDGQSAAAHDRRDVD